MSEAKGVEVVDPLATQAGAGALGTGALDAPLPGKRMLVNLGPSHPAMHGVTRAVVELNGEIIDSMKLDIGFLHRGFEKSCENVTWTQVFPYTDRLNYVSSIMNNVGFALAVEKLAKIDVPDRAKYLRVLSSEIHRICDHLTLVGAMGMELGAMTVFLYAIEARDLLYDRLAELCGARLTSNYARIGGVTRDLPDGWVENDAQDARPRHRGHRRDRRAARPQPHLHRPQPQHRQGVARGRPRPRLHRALPARLGRAVRHPQGGAVPASTTGSTSTSRWAPTATTTIAT